MSRVHRVSALLLVAGGLLVWPAGAGAVITVAPTSLTFADQQVGTTSAPKAVTLTKDCNPPLDTFCFAGAEGPTFNTAISAPSPFSQTNNCPAALTATLAMTSVSCTINVAFAPTEADLAARTLITGAGGPTVSLTGTGTPAPGTAKKKCKKKKKGASAAKKKCKKKKKK